MSTATGRDVDTIEHLDFTPTLPCEHSQHEQRHEDEPAKYAIRATCPACGDTSRGLICHSGWHRITSGAARCCVCDASFPGRDGLHIIEVLP